MTVAVVLLGIPWPAIFSADESPFDGPISVSELFLRGRERVTSGHFVIEFKCHESPRMYQKGVGKRVEVWFEADKWRMDTLVTSVTGNQVRTARILNNDEWLLADWGKNSNLHSERRGGKTRHDAGILDPRLLGRMFGSIGSITSADVSTDVGGLIDPLEAVPSDNPAVTANRYMSRANPDEKLVIGMVADKGGMTLALVESTLKFDGVIERERLDNTVDGVKYFPSRTEYQRWRDGTLFEHYETQIEGDLINQDIDDHVFERSALQVGDVDRVSIQGVNANAMRDGRLVNARQRHEHDVENRTDAIRGRSGAYWIGYLNVAGVLSAILLVSLYFGYGRQT